jgi:hypothetical protein
MAAVRRSRSVLPSQKVSTEDAPQALRDGTIDSQDILEITMRQPGI